VGIAQRVSPPWRWLLFDSEEKIQEFLVSFDELLNRVQIVMEEVEVIEL